MGILGKTDIKKYIKEGKIILDPVADQFQIQPNSLDLRAGWNFYVPQQWQYGEAGRTVTRPDYTEHKANSDHFKLIKLRPGQYFEFLPNEFAIVSTLEKLSLKANDLMALLYPRSSMIRRGFVIESGVVDVGYSGHLTIPVYNATPQPLRLYPGERMYQLVFHTLDTPLADDDAQLHGAVKAKYQDATAHNLQARTDSSEELEFIKSGQLEKIKEQYRASE